MFTKLSKKILIIGLFVAAFLCVSVALAQDEVEAGPTVSEESDKSDRDVVMVPQDGPNNTPQTAFPIECGQTLGKHVTSSSEVDWFKFTAHPGFTLTAFVEADSVGYGDVDATLTLYSGDATTILTSNDDYDRSDPRVHWTTKGVLLLNPQTYYLKVEDYDNSSLGYYYITLERPTYMSMTSSGSIGGVSYAAGDVLATYTCANPDQWEMFLDMSDVGVNANMNGFAMLSGGNFIMSFAGKATVPGLGTVPRQDLVVFAATDVGSTTAGTFSKLFDGSDVGLTTNGEAIDAVMLSPNGNVVVSLEASGAVPGVKNVRDEDLIRFDANQLGDNTSGNWSMYFDGSDEGLGGVDVKSAWHRPVVRFDIFPGSETLFTTFDQAVVTGGEPFDGGDIATCNLSSTGGQTACSSWGMFLDVSVSGFGTRVIDAIDRGGPTLWPN